MNYLKSISLIKKLINQLSTSYKEDTVRLNYIISHFLDKCFKEEDEKIAEQLSHEIRQIYKKLLDQKKLIENITQKKIKNI